MRRHMNARKIALVIALCFAAAENLTAQACQGCTCSGSKEVHPASTLEKCIQGCSIIQLICEGGDIIPTTTVVGLGFDGQPKSVPKNCTIRTIPNGGMLTGQPASGCSKPDAQQASGAGTQGLVPAATHPRLGQGDDRRAYPLRPEPPGRAHTVPRRRPHQARHQYRRAKHPCGA